MHPTQTRLLGATALLAVTCLAGCTGMQGRSRSPESITLPFSLDEWHVGHQGENRQQRIVEFVRSGETVENWSELVTTQTFRKTSSLPGLDAFISIQRQSVASDCPGSTLEVTRRLPDGVFLESQTRHCPSGADEDILGRVVEGTANRFIVQYSVRKPLTMTPERRDEWTKRLLAVELMPY